MAEKTGRVRAVRELAPGVLLFDVQALEPPELAFRAGQFISVRCGDDGARRAYTICSSPERRDGFELLVKAVPGGVGTRYFAGLREGDLLSFTGPMGFFVAAPAHPGDVVLVATGAGIAAALPVAEELAARSGERGALALRWGLRDERDAFWRERLDDLAARAPRFAWGLEVAPEWADVHARLVNAAVAALERLAAPTFYVVGNGALVHLMKQELAARGVDRRKQIVAEAFYPTVEGARP